MWFGLGTYSCILTTSIVNTRRGVVKEEVENLQIHLFATSWDVLGTITNAKCDARGRRELGAKRNPRCRRQIQALKSIVILDAKTFFLEPLCRGLIG